VQERQVRRSQMKGRSRRVNYYQLIRLTRSPNDAKITRYFLTSMTGYLPAMPTRARAHPNGSPLSTSIIRSIHPETTCPMLPLAPLGTEAYISCQSATVAEWRMNDRDCRIELLTTAAKESAR